MKKTCKNLKVSEQSQLPPEVITLGTETD